jgi:hypothetical protein
VCRLEDGARMVAARIDIKPATAEFRFNRFLVMHNAIFEEYYEASLIDTLICPARR